MTGAIPREEVRGHCPQPTRRGQPPPHGGGLVRGTGPPPPRTPD